MGSDDSLNFNMAYPQIREAATPELGGMFPAVLSGLSEFGYEI